LKPTPLWEKWLKPHNWNELPYQWAESRTEQFWEMIKQKEEDQDYEWATQHGIVKGWKHTDKKEILRGFRGEDFVRSMIEDFGISPYQPPINREVYDIYIPRLGTIDVKTSKFGEDCIKIKSTFYKRPSLYVLGIKTCDSENMTFQFVGWLYGHEVYKFPLDRSMPYIACIKIPFTELRSPKSFLNKLRQISKSKGSEGGNP
jgi:hypothetical protein